MPETPTNVALRLPPEPEVGSIVETAGSLHNGTRWRRYRDTEAIHHSTSLRLPERKDPGAFRWGLIRNYAHEEDFTPKDWHTWAQVWSHVVDSVWDEYDPRLILNPSAPPWSAATRSASSRRVPSGWVPWCAPRAWTALARTGRSR